MQAGKIALGLWLTASLPLGAALLQLHPPPPLPRTGSAPASGHWTLVHALALSCPCSGRVLDHLEARGSRADVEERILLIDGDEATRRDLMARGFSVDLIEEGELSLHYGIVAAPSLVILRPDGSVAYRGAHQERPQMPPIELALLARAQHGDAPAPLPIFGCAVSRALQEQLDPLRPKYSRAR